MQVIRNLILAEKHAKYDELIKRDKEMQAFLDIFDEKRHEALTNHQEMEQGVSDLILRIPILTKQTGVVLPTSQGFKELKGDLAFKEKEMNNSSNTMDALLQERDKRIQDFEKVEQLESKLSAELNHLRQRIDSLNSNLDAIKNLDQIKYDAEQTKIVSL